MAKDKRGKHKPGIGIGGMPTGGAGKAPQGTAWWNRKLTKKKGGGWAGGNPPPPAKG